MITRNQKVRCLTSALPIALVGLLAHGAAIPGRAHAETYSALFTFGAEMTTTRGGPYAQGRWCNGPVWVEFLSERLGLVYNSDHNRAQGGANSAGILQQVTALPAPEHAHSALFVVMPAILDLGGNADSATHITFWQLLVGQLMANTATMIERLYLKGARRIVLVNAPDLAKFPQLASLNPPTRSALRVRMEEHNLALRQPAQNAMIRFPGLEVRVADFFRGFDVIFEGAAAFGFTKTTIAAWHDDDLADKSYTGPGRDYLFWDNVQPSSQFHALLARSIEADLGTTQLDIVRDPDGVTVWIQKLRLGRYYSLEFSVDLTEWMTVELFQAIAFDQVHPLDPSGASAAYYRMVLP